jgi:hypothetical protein
MGSQPWTDRPWASNCWHCAHRVIRNPPVKAFGLPGGYHPPAGPGTAVQKAALSDPFFSITEKGSFVGFSGHLRASELGGFQGSEYVWIGT